MSNKPPVNNPASEARNDVSHDIEGEGEIELLLREAGERIQPTPEMSQAVYAAVHAEWQSAVAQRTRRKQVVRWGLAAGIATVAMGTLLYLRFSMAPLPTPVPLASVVKIQGAISGGNVQISANEGATWRDTLEGEVLATGTVVRTDPTTRVALDFGSGRSVRMDADTRFMLLAADQVRLERGGIYVDAPLPGHAPLAIQTAFGAVEHLGTQYQVRLAQDRMTISVREGRVLLSGKSIQAQIAANERVTYDKGGEIARETITSHDAGWSWAMQAAPAFTIDNGSLASFLNWVARETGRTVTYATPDARIQAEQLILRGSIGELSPDQALRAVLATTQFVYTDSAHVIQIGL